MLAMQTIFYSLARGSDRAGGIKYFSLISFLTIYIIYRGNFFNIAQNLSIKSGSEFEKILPIGREKHGFKM